MLIHLYVHRPWPVGVLIRHSSQVIEASDAMNPFHTVQCGAFQPLLHGVRQRRGWPTWLLPNKVGHDGPAEICHPYYLTMRGLLSCRVDCILHWRGEGGWGGQRPPSQPCQHCKAQDQVVGLAVAVDQLLQLCDDPGPSLHHGSHVLQGGD